MESATAFILVCLAALGVGFLLQVLANIVLWVLNHFQ